MKTLLGLVLLFGLAAPLWAGPPFQTDDPEPTDYKHWEIYLGTAGFHAVNSGWTLGMPFLSLNYGGFPDTQLSLTTQMTWNAPDRELSPQYGYGDMLLGVKYRFLHETNAFPEAAFFPQVNVPTGDTFKGLGSGQVQILLPVWFQKNWDNWSSYGGGGYWVNPGAGNKNWIFLGWELQRDFGEVLTLGGEVFYHGSSMEGQPDGMGFNLGGMFHFDPVNHIVFSLGRDIAPTTYDLTGFVAYEWTFSDEAKGKE